MRKDQIKLIQDTWRSVGPIENMVPQIFYDRLFEIDPSTKPLFASVDMTRQHRRLLDTLALIADNAEDLHKIKPFLTDLGERHVGYGVTDAHYKSMGSALIWTLERSFGTAFTSEARQAWTKAYGFAASIMQEAAQAASN